MRSTGALKPWFKRQFVHGGIAIGAVEAAAPMTLRQLPAREAALAGREAELASVVEWLTSQTDRADSARWSCPRWRDWPG